MFLQNPVFYSYIFQMVCYGGYTYFVVSMARTFNIVHYLPPGKYQPGYHISKLDTVYIHRTEVIQYTIMEDALTEILGIDKELTTVVRQRDHHLNQNFIWIFSTRSPNEFQM